MYLFKHQYLFKLSLQDLSIISFQNICQFLFVVPPALYVVL